MQHDWFMYHLRSTYKNRLDFPFIRKNVCQNEPQGGISSSVLSVFFTDNCYKLLKSLHLIGWEQIGQWKTLTKRLMKCPPGVTDCPDINYVPDDNVCALNKLIGGMVHIKDNNTKLLFILYQCI